MVSNIPRSPLSRTALQVVDTLFAMPLANAAELSKVLGVGQPQVQLALRDLAGHGFVSSDRLGGSMDGTKPARRWHLTDQPALRRMGATWNDEGNRAVLLTMMPLLQWFYCIAGSVTGLGALTDFLWLEETHLDAAACYERGWVGFVWAGMLETPDELLDRIEAWGQNLISLGGREAWPARWCWVAADEWQRKYVLEAARAHTIEEFTSVWCVTQGPPTIPLQLNPAPGRGQRHQRPRSRDIGNWPWERRVRSSLWSQPNSPRDHRVFRLIAEYPGITTEMGREALGEARTGDDFARGCRVLVDMELIERTQFRRKTQEQAEDIQVEQQQHFSLTGKGIDIFVRENRGTARDYQKRVLAQSLIKKPDRRAHEEGVIALMAQCRRAGLAVAAGWRCYLSMGSSGSVVPDGMVRLTDGPYGPGWCYLEYELSARGQARIRKKLRGYMATERQDRYPVLVVSWNEKSECNLQTVSAEGNLRVLTTTRCRLQKYGPLNTFDCWSQFGERVRIS